MIMKLCFCKPTISRLFSCVPKSKLGQFDHDFYALLQKMFCNFYFFIYNIIFETDWRKREIKVLITTAKNKYAGK